jgi:hypothetical protein
VWRDKKQIRTEGAHMACEMKSRYCSFQEVKLGLVGHDANKDAHRCAKEALSVADRFRFDIMYGF